MDQLDTQDKTALAGALLGLRAGKDNAAAVGETPTAEDFGALYEGSLDATRRAQVLSHIAADPAVYREFLEVASAQATLDESLTEDVSGAVEAAPPLLQRIGSWLGDMVRTPALSGGMVAAALVVVLLIPGQDGDLPSAGWQEIDQIYADYGNDWRGSPSSMRQPVTRGFGKKEVPAEQWAIYRGLESGLDLLGEEFPRRWLPAVKPGDNAASLPEDLQATLEATGKLATLSRFQCGLDGSQAFFIAAQTSMDNLRVSLAEDNSKTSRHLVKVIDQPGEPQVRVCEFSNATVALLTNS